MEENSRGIKSFSKFFRGPSGRDLAIALGFGIAVALVSGMMLPGVFFHPKSSLAGGHSSSFSLWSLVDGVHKWASFKLGSFFDGNIFYPLSSTVTLGDHYFLPSLLFWPISSALGSWQGAYNISVFLLLGLNAGAFFWAVRRLGIDWPVATFSALIFSINQFRWGNLGHFNTLLTFFLPLLFLFFEKTRVQMQLRFFSFLGLTIFLLALSSRGLFQNCIPAFLLGLVILGTRLQKTRVVLMKVWPWAAGLLLVLLLWWRPYSLAQNWFEWEVIGSSLREESNRWVSLFDHQGQLKIFAWLFPKLGSFTKGALFFGLTEWLFFLSSIVLAAREIKQKRLPWRGPEMAQYAGILFLMAWYLGASMGPNGDGEFFGANMFRLTSYFPGELGLHSPNQMSIFVHFLVVLLSCFIWGKKYQSSSAPVQRKLQIVFGCFALFYLAEMLPNAAPNQEVTVESQWQGLRQFFRAQPKAPVVVLSTSSVARFIPAMIENPTVNGPGVESSQNPGIFHEIIRPRLASCDSANCIDFLRQLGIRYILIDGSDDATKQRGIKLEEFTGVKRVFDEASWVVLELEGTAAWKKLVNGNQGFMKKLQPWKAETCFPAKDVHVSNRFDKVGMTHDGMFGTMWQSDQSQSAAESWVEVELPDESRGNDVLIEFESGFDGNVRHGFFARDIQVFRLRDKNPQSVKNAASRLYLKEPYKLVEQVFAPLPKTESVSSIRVVAQQVPGVEWPWGIGEVRVCRLETGS